jgi:TonB-linked SusC/RagA family outer membrane protein
MLFTINQEPIMRKVSPFIRIAVLLLFIFSLPSYGQSQTTSGIVQDADKKTLLAGVTVKVIGNNNTAQTDDRGAFTIKASVGQFLSIAYVGYELKRVTVTGSKLNILLKEEVADLGEVVVAMDIKRKPRELGYSVQTVKGSDIKDAQRENFVNSLQGRVAGATITPTTGTVGASTQIVLRGFNSLSLSNSPLFVVDGVILDNSTLNQTSGGGTSVGLASDLPNRNNDYTNRAADLNPNDIESITVLKGPEATALYGSQASSGAIVITTKKTKTKGIVVAYDNSFRTQKITRFNRTINTYTTGANGVYTPNFGTSSSFFGPAYGRDVTFYDNVHDFFKTGFSQTHNLSVDFGTKNSGYRLSTSYLDQAGVVPSNTFKKFNIRLSNTTKIGKYFDFTPSISYINSDNYKPLRGSGSYLLDLYVWPSDNDISNWLSPTGHKLLFNSTDLPNAELDNPFFSAIKNKSEDKLDRVFSTLGVNFYPTSWLTIAGRFGYDYYKQIGYTFIHPESYEISAALAGSLDNYYRKYFGYNHTITATAKKSVGKFSGRVMVGTMWQDQETQMFGVYGTNLKDSVSIDSSNTLPGTRVRLLRNNYGQPNLSQFRDFAYFGEAALSYNNYLFLSYTHRFEQASVFPSSTRNYNYPGVSFSAIVSDIFPSIKSNTLNYLKIRASKAQTARLADPYSNQNIFINSLASGGGYLYGFTNANPNLRPERQKTWEVGAEIRMFSNILSLEASYYNTLVTDQIIEAYRSSYATGYTINTANIANTRNQGIELSLNLNPIRTTDWSWNIIFNFNKMFSKVLLLPPGLTQYYIGDTKVYGSVQGSLFLNGPTTTVAGYTYMRNTKGDVLIDPATGLPKINSTASLLGDRNPNFTLGTINSIRFKNWNLSFLWDLKVGGDIFDATDMYLTTQGRSSKTADRKTARVVKGILQDGLENSSNPTMNNIVVIPYYQQTFYTTMPEEEFMQKNVNWLRLRDLTLTYNFSDKALKNLKYFKTLGLFLTANDLLLFTNYAGADPAVNANTASNGGIGGFGIDYGSLPTPVSINIGLKTSF